MLCLVIPYVYLHITRLIRIIGMKTILSNIISSILEKIELLIQAYPYRELFSLKSLNAKHGIDIEFFDAGHILGSAGISLECNGFSIFHTGDVQFEKQSLLPGASFPKRHYDIVFSEATELRHRTLRKEVKKYRE